MRTIEKKNQCLYVNRLSHIKYRLSACPIFVTKPAPKLKGGLRDIDRRMYSKLLDSFTVVYPNITKNLQYNMARPTNQEGAPPRTIQTVPRQQIETIPPRPVVAHNNVPQEPQENENVQDNSNRAESGNNTFGTEFSTITNNTALQTILFNTRANRINVKQAVKKVLFPNIKFLASKDDLEYSLDKHSVSQIILTSLNVPEDHTTRNICWVQVRHLISEYLNFKRTSVVHAIKHKFNGT